MKILIDTNNKTIQLLESVSVDILVSSLPNITFNGTGLMDFKIIPAPEINDELITAEWLMGLHGIKSNEAHHLLEFAKENTIVYKSCYGNGEIIFPMWKESIK